MGPRWTWWFSTALRGKSKYLLCFKRLSLLWSQPAFPTITNPCATPQLTILVPFCSLSYIMLLGVHPGCSFPEMLSSVSLSSSFGSNVSSRDIPDASWQSWPRLTDGYPGSCLQRHPDCPRAGTTPWWRPKSQTLALGSTNPYSRITA